MTKGPTASKETKKSGHSHKMYLVLCKSLTGTWPSPQHVTVSEIEADLEL